MSDKDISSAETGPEQDARRLESWKEIAAYLGRDVRTVQRWERGEGLPVHRLQHNKLGSVYAYPSELDAWRRRHEPMEALSSSPEPQPAAAAPRRAITVTLVAGVVLLAAVSAFAVWWMSGVESTDAHKVTRLAMALPSNTQLPLIDLAISRDGRRLVYVVQDLERGDRVLYLRELDRFDSQLLHGTEGGRQPFFSPDGEWIGFISDALPEGNYARPGRLKKVAIRGGPPIILAEASALGGSWSDDDTIVFARANVSGTGLYRIPAAGGTAERLTAPQMEDGKERHAWPEHVPGTDTLVFSITHEPSFDQGKIAVLSLRTREVHTVIAQGYHARFLHSGHLAYVLSGNMMAIRFDRRSSQPIGSPQPVIESTSHEPISGRAAFSVSSDGLLVYFAGAPVSRKQLMWVTREGHSTPVIPETASYSYPRLSPDGRRLAVGIDREIWIIDLLRSTRTRLTAEDRGISPPPAITAWTPDGRLTFNRRLHSPETTIEWIHPNAGETAAVLLRRPQLIAAPSWSQDGKLMTFFEFLAPTSRNIWVLDLRERELQPKPFLITLANERAPRFSPDGRWIAYVSNSSGQDEVFLKPYPGPGAQVPVSLGRGTEPVWSSDAHELFYREGNRMIAVPLETSPALSLGQAHVLFEEPFILDPSFAPQYDVSPDGKRFIMISSPEQTTPGLAVVQNWFDELKRLPNN